MRERAYTVGIMTVSDKGAAGIRRDESGQLVGEVMEENGYEVASYTILPKEKEILEEELIRLCDEVGVDIILTVGGIGFAKRDVAPEATFKIAHKWVPGIADAIRAHGMSITKNAMLSRGTSVIRKRTLIINLPGNPKAAFESLLCIMPQLKRGLDTLKA